MVMALESILAIDKNRIQEAAKTLAKEDIPPLMDWLSSKDDSIRYQVLLLLQKRKKKR
ncbi:MAG: hypothetical protein AAGU12_05760 [Clostridiales bacterium]